MSEYLNIVTRDRICQILLNRPDKKNALTLSMYEGLTQALKDADANPDVRVILLGSTGDSFCSGNDIGDFIGAINSPNAVQAPLQFLQTISSLIKPVVAVVPGVAVGIGVTMLLHCDLVIASDQANFQLPFARLGLVPEGGASLIVPQLVGHRRAFELLVMGESFSAVTAADLGIINRTVEQNRLQEQSLLEAGKLASLAPDAVRQSKAMLRSVSQSQMQEVLLAEVEQFAARLKSEEAMEALQAFMQKREPDFSRF
ncbi:enoyl-CoA hydratase-related protein [Amphritea japonica]|uniref:Enoyl-CoA hydratase/isomerase family protein n=1 Tax=Amphritea japonica ATCC BAA-1530 TaxID=1278309 RepID=A0A7R6PEB2_9GAMM|nr:enoyl-CoA hydratase-related protein [Amphritea japonica]BBB27501.1 enoyl-CoA hydratase/isomerase family protein [Amphritea japonica ATCC BAA-1530]